MHRNNCHLSTASLGRRWYSDTPGLYEIFDNIICSSSCQGISVLCSTIIQCFISEMRESRGRNQPLLTIDLFSCANPHMPVFLPTIATMLPNHRTIGRSNGQIVESKSKKTTSNFKCTSLAWFSRSWFNYHTCAGACVRSMAPLSRDALASFVWQVGGTWSPICAACRLPFLYCRCLCYYFSRLLEKAGSMYCRVFVDDR